MASEALEELRATPELWLAANGAGAQAQTRASSSLLLACGLTCSRIFRSWRFGFSCPLAVSLLQSPNTLALTHRRPRSHTLLAVWPIAATA
eukprot:1466600-Pleurochrysis_carterae.AAC.1